MFIAQNKVYAVIPNSISTNVTTITAPNTIGEYYVIITTYPIYATYTAGTVSPWITVVVEYPDPRTTTLFIESNAGAYRTGTINFLHQDGITGCHVWVNQAAGGYSGMGMMGAPVIFAPIGIDNLA